MHLARMKPARLILAVRTVSKGETAAKEIRERTNNACPVEVWQLEQANFASVKAFTQRVTTELDRLDIALLNAGMVAHYFKRSVDGYEEMYAGASPLSTVLTIHLG